MGNIPDMPIGFPGTYTDWKKQCEYIGLDSSGSVQDILTNTFSINTVSSKSQLDNIKEPKEGTIYYCKDDGSSYLYCNNWEQLSSIEPYYPDSNENKKMVPKYMHCRSCGASVNPERNKCAFCDCIYEYQE